MKMIEEVKKREVTGEARRKCGRREQDVKQEEKGLRTPRTSVKIGTRKGRMRR